MNARTYYYARVSTRDQNLDRQIAAFRQLGADERDIITDKESGKDLNRPGYAALKQAMLRPGDTLVITSLDRLSRNKNDIKSELEYLKNLGVRVKILDLPTTMMDLPKGQEWVFDMVNNILIEVLGTMAEKERAFTRQRQAEGYAAARLAGKKMGRPALTKPANWNEVIQRWRAGSLSAADAMQQLGLTRYAFYKLLREDQ